MDTARRVRLALVPAVAILVALMVPLLPVRAAPIGGTLTGTVVMKTAGASLPTTPLTVTLLYLNPGLFRDEAATESRTTTTAPDGSFSFTGLDTTAAGVYRVIVQYKGIGYEPAPQPATSAGSSPGSAGQTRAVTFPANATTVSTQVPIYEPAVSDTPASFTVQSHEIIINEVRPQFYSVLEDLEIANPGDHTLVGALNPDGSMAQGVPVVFSAPPGAEGISTNRIDLIPGADLTGQKLTLRAPIQPGQNDVEATYNLNGTANGVPFTRTLDYATPKLQILVSDSRQAIFSTTLKDDGPIQAPQGATPFREFSLDNAQAGQTVDLTIGPSPPTTTQTTPAPKPSLFTRLRERLTVPFLLGLAVICLILIFFILRAPVGEKSATAQRAPRGRGSRQPGKSAAGEVGEGEEVESQQSAVESRQSEESADDSPSRLPTANSRLSARPRRIRGRPADYDLDEDERAIEEANEEGGRP